MEGDFLTNKPFPLSNKSSGSSNADLWLTTVIGESVLGTQLLAKPFHSLILGCYRLSYIRNSKYKYLTRWGPAQPRESEEFRCMTRLCETISVAFVLRYYLSKRIIPTVLNKTSVPQFYVISVQDSLFPSHLRGI